MQLATSANFISLLLIKLEQLKSNSLAGEVQENFVQEEWNSNNL